MHVLGYARRGVQRDRGPDRVGILFGDTVAAEEIASGVSAVDLEPLFLAAVARHQADVVKHGAGVKQFAVELQSAMSTGQRAKMIDAAGMVEKQLRLGITNKF